MSLSANILANISSLIGAAKDHGDAQFRATLNTSYEFTTGGGANQANSMFADQRTLAASTGEDLDLAGSLTDALGQTLTFTAVKALLVKAAAANGSTLSVGGAAANGFNSIVGAAGDIVKVRPGGLLLLVANDATGFAVTAGTGDLLRIANDDAGAAATYDIIVIGE